MAGPKPPEERGEQVQRNSPGEGEVAVGDALEQVRIQGESMGVSQQSNSPWHKMAKPLSGAAIANAAGLATAIWISPIGAGPVTNILKVLLDSQKEQFQRLEEIKADTQAILQGPYNTGLSWLRDAARAHSTDEERRDFIEKARDKFMEAYGNELRVPFRRALIEFHVGICWTLLGSNDHARDYFQQAHASAMDYLSDKGRALRAAEDAYMESQQLVKQAFKKSSIARTLLIAPVFTVPTMMSGALLVIREKNKQTYNKIKEEFTEEAPTILAFIDALEQLRIQAPALALEFQELSPKMSTLHEWVKSR
jgi:hypothetical protein